jgi:rhodanese-related sulfurtransferase
MEHSPGFLKMVDKARPGVPELSISEARERLARNPQAVFMDVREDDEWSKGHAAEAVHLGKGVLERDIERMFPEKDREIIMYCGGGYRSIMTAAAAREMGYTNVFSLTGGFKALVQANWPMAR